MSQAPGTDIPHHIENAKACSSDKTAPNGTKPADRNNDQNQHQNMKSKGWIKAENFNRKRSAKTCKAAADCERQSENFSNVQTKSTSNF